MNLSLLPEMERYITEKVESGEFLSSDEVNRLRLEALRKEVTVGLEQMERGEYTTHDDASFTELAEQIKADAFHALHAFRSLPGQRIG